MPTHGASFETRLRLRSAAPQDERLWCDGARAVAAARALIGTRFRLHGRDAHGIDCVGLAAVAAGVDAAAVPTGYSLRGGSVARVIEAMAAAGLVAAEGRRAGDLWLSASGPAQLHLSVLTDTGFVHADAGLRRVVEVPGDPPGRRIGHWRRGAG